MAQDGSRVRLADHAGFCFGVRRALGIAEEAMGRGKIIYSLGPLIHNAEVVRRLQERGLNPVEKIEQAQDALLVIRSHGVPPAAIEQASEMNIGVIDATCPIVRRVHEKAKKLRDEGYEVVIVGERNHPEVIGILGWLGDKAFVVEDSKEATELPRFRRAGVVAQTTQTLENFRSVVAHLASVCDEVQAYNTLCDATSQAQISADELSRDVDVMLVVGGYHSGNTRRLAQICRQNGAQTYHIESAEELQPDWFEGAENVGVTAGASTPDWAIEEVLVRASELMDQVASSEPSQVLGG